MRLVCPSQTTIKLSHELIKCTWLWLWMCAMSYMLYLIVLSWQALVAVNSRRKMYSVLRGPFSEGGILEYMRELIGGRGRTISFKGDTLPTVADIEPWDGKDGEVSVSSHSYGIWFDLIFFIFAASSWRRLWSFWLWHGRWQRWTLNSLIHNHRSHVVHTLELTFYKVT